MQIAIVPFSTVSLFDNWSAEFQVGGREAVQYVEDLAHELSYEKLKLKLKINLCIIESNVIASKIALQKCKPVISAAIGGVSNQPNRVNLELIVSYLKASLTPGKGRLYVSLAVSFILIHAIKKSEADIRQYIQEELEKVAILEDSIDSIMQLPAYTV